MEPRQPPKMEYGLEPPPRSAAQTNFVPSYWPPKEDESFHRQIKLLLPDQRRELFYMKKRKDVSSVEKDERDRQRYEFLSQKEVSSAGGSASLEAKMLLKRLALEEKSGNSSSREDRILRPYRENSAAYNELMARFEAFKSKGNAMIPTAPSKLDRPLLSPRDLSPRCANPNNYFRPDSPRNAGSVTPSNTAQQKAKLGNELRVKFWLTIVRTFRAMKRINHHVLSTREFIQKQGIRWTSAKIIQRHWRNYINIKSGIKKSSNVWLNIVRQTKGQAKAILEERTTACTIIIQFIKDASTGVRKHVNHYLKSVRKLQFFIRRHLRRNSGRLLTLNMLIDRFITALIPSIQSITSPKGLGLDMNLGNAERASLMKLLKASDSPHQVIQKIATPEFHSYLRAHMNQVRELLRTIQAYNNRPVEPMKRKFIVLSSIFSMRRNAVKNMLISRNHLNLPVFTDADAYKLMTTGYDHLTTCIQNFLDTKDAEHKEKEYMRQHRNEKIRLKFKLKPFANLFSTVKPEELLAIVLKMYDTANDISYYDRNYNTTNKKKKASRKQSSMTPNRSELTSAGSGNHSAGHSANSSFQLEEGETLGSSQGARPSTPPKNFSGSKPVFRKTVNK